MPSSSSSATAAVFLLLVSLLATSLASDSDHKVRLGSPHSVFVIYSSNRVNVSVDLVICMVFNVYELTFIYLLGRILELHCDLGFFMNKSE